MARLVWPASASATSGQSITMDFECGLLLLVLLQSVLLARLAALLSAGDAEHPQFLHPSA